MVKMTVTKEMPISAEAAWSIVGAFNWLPVISTPTASSTLAAGGGTRVLVNSDGSILWERLLEYDFHGKSLAYEIIDEKGCESMAYGAGFIGRIDIEPGDGNTSVYRYTAEFTPRTGVDEEVARRAVDAFVTDCATGVVRASARGTIGAS